MIHMKIIVKLISLLVLLLLSGCNPVRFEYFNIVPAVSDFYEELLVEDLIIAPYFKPNTKNILSETKATYTGPYSFSLKIRNGVNEKKRILKKVIPINMFLLVNGRHVIAQEELSDLKKWRKFETENHHYVDSVSTEFYSRLILDIDWKNLETLKVHVEFKAIFEENGKEYEQIIKREIDFVPYHDIKDTTGFSRLVVYRYNLDGMICC
jgi:hypothetical protein